MIAVLQRVSAAAVTIAGNQVGAINTGILILLGIEDSDTGEDLEWLCRKIVNLRIFNDENGVMNLSVTDIKGQLLVVSQFTLHASTKKGNRPSYSKAARPEKAIPLFEEFITRIEKSLGRQVATGKFGADMAVSLVNDGPVTILLDTKNKQ